MLRIILGVALLGTVLAGCGDDQADDDGRIDVVASFFPLAEAARVAGGDAVDVRDLTPPGAEPHDLELSTDDVNRLLDADVAVILGGDFQPGVERVAGRRDGPTIVALDVPGIPAGEDPHVWLDPTAMARIVGAVATALDEAGVAGALDRADDYADELQALDTDLATGLEPCRGRTMVVAHAAFGRLADRYGLEQRSISGLAPDQEADPRTLDRLADVIREEGIPTVFAEELLSAEEAETLAREAGAEVEVLDPLESGEPGGYVEAMRHNLRTLRHGLRC
jgi:zinc transport system substrate-binding protein